MSASMSAFIAPHSVNVFVEPGDNQFQLNDRERKTQITLNLGPQGSPLAGSETQGPTLRYQGAEGTIYFSGRQIAVEESALGRLYTVTLNTVPDLRVLSFTLLLPLVAHKEGQKVQFFETIAIKSERHTSLDGTPTMPGAETTFLCMQMRGTAAKVEVLA